MRTFILTILLIHSIICFGQESDSTIYYIYKSTKNVTDIKYIKNFYSNGQIKSEGWTVFEKPSPNSEILEIKNWNRYYYIEHKFGIWKRYYKSGQIAGIDSIGFYKNEISKQYDYNEKGCLTKIVVLKPLVIIDKVNGHLVTAKMDDLEWIDYFNYTCDGMTFEEHFLYNYIRTGIWKWYKNGKVVKTKEFKDNKLIETKKYGT